jgi:predicted secreted protein
MNTPSTPDDLFDAYLQAKQAVKDAEEHLDQLRLQVMATVDAEPSDRVKVTVSTSERVESLKAIADKSPSLLKALHEIGAIKEVKQTRLTVKPRS